MSIFKIEVSNRRREDRTPAEPDSELRVWLSPTALMQTELCETSTGGLSFTTTEASMFEPETLVPIATEGSNVLKMATIVSVADVAEGKYRVGLRWSEQS